MTLKERPLEAREPLLEVALDGKELLGGEGRQVRPVLRHGPRSHALRETRLLVSCYSVRANSPHGAHTIVYEYKSRAYNCRCNSDSSSSKHRYDV